MAEFKNIKMLLVLPFFYPHRGGSQKYAEEIFARIVKNHPDTQVDVLCYNTDKVSAYEEYRGFRIYRIPCLNIIPARFALPNPISLIVTLIKLARNKYDFVNTHIRFFDPTWWLWLYAKLIGAKSIFTGHVAIHPVHQNKTVAFIAKLTDLTLAKFSLKFYDHLTFTNKTAEKFFRERLGVRKVTHIIYGGVDTRFFEPSPKNNRIIPKIDKIIEDDQVIITFVGRLIWTKGVTILYKAIKELENSPNMEKAVFVLAGPGELENEIKDNIVKDGLDNKVLLTGNLSYEQVRDLLGISDIFINPSHHNEGFPNTVLEAGASGAYVIATDNAGTWEVIRNGETGSLIPQKDVKALEEAVLWAVNNKEKREEIALNFRHELEQGFDWEIISEQLYDLISINKNGLDSNIVT
jgi:glycosyltransferase involved in cell wall biosynthesis